MNIELKPIAESKVRQLGGDVCGVLVRDDSGVMAVSEHGRCTRLDAGVMGPVEPAEFNERELFEQRFPVPAGIYWNDISEQYDALPGAAGFDDVEIYHGQWMGWQAARAQGGQGVEPVAEIVHDYNGISVQWLEPAKYGRFQSGQKLYTQPQPAVPEESRPLQVNRYGVDRDYFTKKLEIIIRDMRDYTPSELARSLGRLAITANSETMREPEFNIGDLIDQPKYRDSTSTTPQADGCPECGSTDLTWHTQSSVTTGTPDGKLRANEVSTLFVLGCGHCSETIKTLTADQVAENMSPLPPAGQEGAQ